MQLLPEAEGPRIALTPGPAPLLRLAILGDSAAAGVGAKRQDEALAGHLSAFTAQYLGRRVSWRLVARSGATARSVLRDLVPRLTNPRTAWRPGAGATVAEARTPPTAPSAEAKDQPRKPRIVAPDEHIA